MDCCFCYKSLTIEQLLNYNKIMELRKTDCEAINPELVEKILPNMPDLTELYDLSDFLK